MDGEAMNRASPHTHQDKRLGPKGRHNLCRWRSLTMALLRLAQQRHNAHPSKLALLQINMAVEEGVSDVADQRSMCVRPTDQQIGIHSRKKISGLHESRVPKEMEIMPNNLLEFNPSHAMAFVP